MSTKPRYILSVAIEGVVRDRLWALKRETGITPSHIVRAALTSYFRAKDIALLNTKKET